MAFKDLINKTQNYINTTTPKASEPSASLSSTSAYQANLKTTAPANTNWYSGSKPTYAEAYGRIMEIGQKDPTAARNMWDNLQTLRKDPTSVYYNPYTQPTNQAVNEFRNLGAEFNTVNDAFYEGFGFLKAFYNTGTTNNPTSPGKKATPQEQAAYQYYQILKAEDKTKKAEKEWAALQEELGYWAKRKDLNLSDDDIIKKINWKNYSTLAEMDESAAGGFPIELNRAVGYSQDAMRGVLWAARNGSSGDTDRDAAYAALGYGNQWQMDTDIAKKMDATSDSYAPFSVGCNMDDEAVYFGMEKFDQKWVDANRNILNGEDETAKKYYANVVKAVQETEEAKAQWERFQNEITKRIERSDSPEKALAKLEEILGDSDYSKLAKLRKAEETGEHIDITDNVGFGWNVVRQMVNDGFANKDTRSLSEKSATGGTNIPDTRDKTANAAADANLNDSLDDIESNGTDADKARAKAVPKSSYDADVDGAMNVTVTDPEAASRAVTDSAGKDYLENYFTIGGVNYNYTTAEANVGTYTQRRDELLASLGDKAQAALNARRDNGLLEGIEGVTDTMPIIDQMREYTTQDGRYEIHTHFDGAKYVFDYAIDNYDDDRENLTEDDLNAETAEGFARGFLDDILAGQQNLVDLTDEEKQTVADIRQLNALIERDKKYMTEHEAEYQENVRKRREYEDRMLASMGTSRDAWGTVRNQDAKYCFAVGDYLAATCSNYAATVWSEYDAAQSIQNAMQEGSTPEQIDQAVQTARKNIETELKNVEAVRAYLERTGAKLPGDYSKNLDRHENKLKRDLQDLDMYDLRKKDDYAEMVAKGREMEAAGLDLYDLPGDEGQVRQIRRVNFLESDIPMGFMTEDEKNNYYYIMAKDGVEAAHEYFNYLNDGTYGVLNTRMMKGWGEYVEEKAQDGVLGFIGANALEILSQPGKLFGAAYAWGAGLFGDEVNPYNPMFAANITATSALQGSKEAISNVSGGSGTFMDNILQGLYDIVINRANSAMMGSLTGAFSAGDAEKTARGFVGFLKNAVKETAHAIPMGLGAGADTWREIKITGGSDTQAIKLAVVTTLSETITEGVSLENMREAFGSSVFSPVTIKEFLKNWLTKAGVSEAIGETLNDAIENLHDELIMGDLSDHARNVFAYQCEGYGVDEAEAMARRDEIKGLFRTALVSYLTPGLDVISFYQGYKNDSRYVKGWSRMMGEDLTEEQTVEEIRALREDRENWVKNKLAQRLAPAGKALQTAQESAQETPQESTQETVNEPSEEEQYRIDLERKLNAQYKDRALLAASKKTDDSTERTAILTAIFMNSANPADDIQAAEARELAEAAAVMLNASLGDDVQNIYDYLQVAWNAGIDADVLKQAIQNGILSGNSEVFGMLTGQNVEFNEANILARTQMLYEAGMRDAQNQTVINGVRNAVRESRISKQVQTLIAQGAMGEVQNAKKKLNTAKENVRLAEKNYTEKSNDLKEKKNQLRSIKEQFLDNPGDDNMKNEMTRLTGEVTRAAAVETEYRQSLENARKGLTDAQSDYDRISKGNYASLRAQAEAAVNAEDEQRGIVRAEAQAAVQAQQQAQAEAQRIEDEESGKTEELSDEQKIRQRVDRIKADRNLSDEEANDLYNRYMRINEAAKTKDLNMLVSDPQAKKLIGRMARRLGVRIITGETGAAKGVYRNGTIILSNKLTVADAVLETAMHEVTHSLEQTKSYKTYAKIAIESMYGSEDSAAYHEAANRIAQDWAANGKELDADGIRSELVAEFTREHLSDRDTIERLLDNGLGYTIRNALHKINEFFQSIRHMFGDNPPKEIDAFKQAEQAFKDAINERKNTAVHPQAEQFSVPQLAQAAGYVFDEATTAMYRPGDIDENGKVREGAKPVEEITAKDIQNSPLGMLVDTAVTLNPVNFTTYKRGEDGRYMSDENGLIVEKTPQQTADEINQMFADLATMCCKYRDNNLVWEIAASTLESQFSAIKSNSDDQYGTTVDFGTVCAKTQALINALSRDMVKLGRGLTQAEIMDVYNDVYQADLTVPCPVCYVFSRWMGVPGMLESIRQYQNRFLGEDKNGNILNDRDTIQRMVDEYVANVKDKYYVLGKKDSEGNEITLAKQYSNAKSRITQRINNQETNRMNAVRELNAYNTGNYGALLAFHRENVNAAQRAYDRAVSENKPEKTIVNRLKALNSAKKNLTAFEILAKNQDESAVAKKREAAQKKLDRALAAKETAMQELNEMEAFNWLTQVLCHEEGDRFVLNDDYKRVPDDVLLDLNRTADFVKYEGTWKYRTSRGAGMGKAILPYSGASIGDSLSGVSRWSEDENPVLAKDKVGIGRAIANKIASVRAQNLIGGQRFQSTSDYRPEWGLDYMMTFLEQQCLGSKGQLYTKVIEAVDLLASAGIDVNLSLMGAGDGYVTDENGNKHLVFSDVTGINFDQAYEKTLQYDNVQMILVGFNDDHIRLALADDRIDFIIPWHSSGNSDKTVAALMSFVGETQTNSKDYSPFQNDKVNPDATEEQKNRWNIRTKIITGAKLTDTDVETIDNDPILKRLYDRFNVEGVDPDCYHVKLNSEQASHIFPYEYWDKSLTKEQADQNGRNFVDYCEAMGMIPRFEAFANDKGYWKLLIDRRMYDRNGNYRDQQTINVTNTSISQLPNQAQAKYRLDSNAQRYQQAFNAFDERMGLPSDIGGEQNAFQNGMLVTDADIAQELARDQEYLDLAKNPEQNQEHLQQMVDNAAETAGFTIKGYHGTNAVFTRFDPEKLGSKNFAAGSAYLGFFAAKSKETAESYTGLNNLDAMSMMLNAESSQKMEEIKRENNFDEVTRENDAAKEAFEQEYKRTHGYPEEVDAMLDMIKELPGSNQKVIDGMRLHFEYEWNKKHLNDMIAAWDATNEAKEYEKFNQRLYSYWEQYEVARKGYVPHVMDLYIKMDNPFVYDFKGEGRDTESFAARMAYAKDNGYDGCIFLNVEDGAGFDDIYTVFSNTQLKSADPVTYDDNGNVIPLSQRFDVNNEDTRFSFGGTITDADIMQDLVDTGILAQGDADFATPRMGAVGMLADTIMQNGKNTNPVGLKSGQRIISDLMQSLGLTSDARHARYDRRRRDSTLGYTYQDSVIHIQDAQNVITAAHELGHIFDKVFDMQKYTKDWQTLKDNYIKIFKGGDEFLGGYSPDRINGEIMAEFTAAYMYDRNSAVKMAGEDFVNHFEEDLSKKGWLKPFQQASEEAQKWINASASARAQAVVQLELPKEKVDDKLETVGRKLFDRTLPLLKLTNAAKESGYYSADTDARTLKLAQDSMIANLTHACLTEKLRDPKGNVVTDKDGVEYGSLKDILNQVDAKDEQVFNTYWLLLHAQDRQNLTDENGNNVGKAVFSKRVDVDTAINEIKAQHKDFDKIIEQAEEWYTQFMQTWLVDQGLLSQDDFNTMRQMYPHYVPTFRTKDDFNKVINTAISSLHGDATRSPVRRARGSEADIYNPVMGMAEYVQKYVSYQKQVETLRAFSDQMDAVLDGAIDGILPFAEPAQKDMAYENNKRSNDEVRNAVWDQAAAEVLGGEMTIDALNRIEAVMEKISDTSAWLMPTATGEDVINVPMADGTVKSWVVYDKAMFEALAQMPPVKRNAVVRAFSAVTNFLAKMATGLNIKFSGQNFFSDSETAMNTGHAGWWRSLLPGYAISQITTAFNYAVNKAKDALGKETSKAYQDFQIFGLTGSRYLLRDKNSQRSLRRELYKDSFKAMNGLQKFGRAISAPVRTIGSITEFFEEVTRFNEFLHSRTDATDYAGLLEAGKNAREVTVDFSKRGTADMSYARAFIPFIGAQMQGIYKTLRMFSSENAGNRVKTAVRIVANGIMTNLLMTAWKNLTWDDDDKEDYELLSPYEANKYWHIKVGKGQFLRVKRSQDALLQLADQIGTFIGNVVTEYDNDPFGQLYAGALEIVKGMMPGVDSNILSPISDANHNETWWGGQIDSASDLENNVLQRYDEDTSALGVVFSALSNTVGLKWSPKAWDYVIQQYTGSLGAFGLATIRRAADGEAIPVAMWNHFKEEIAKAFSVNPVKSNGISSAFYNSKKTLSEIIKAYEGGIMPATVKDGMEEEAYQEAKRLLEKGGEINKAQAKAGNLLKKYNALEDNPNLTESQKNEAQMEVRREINTTFLEAQEIIDDYRNKYTHGIPALDSITAVVNFFNHAKSPEAEYHDPIEEMHPYLQQSVYADQFKSVFNKTYDTNMLPHPSASRTIDKETYTIPEELWDEYNDYYIERYDDKIDDLLDGREWDDLTENEQIEILKSAHTYANTLNAKWKREIKEYHE